MNVWVTLRDGAASAEVIGAYATETEAEAAAFRQQQKAENYGSLEVLKFELDTPGNLGPPLPAFHDRTIFGRTLWQLAALPLDRFLALREEGNHG